MDKASGSRIPYDLRRISQNRHLSRVWIAAAERVISQSKELCRMVHERRKRSDFTHLLAKYAQTFPRLRQCLPLAGGGDNDLLQIKTEERPEGMVAHVSGEVDLANADRFKSAIQPALSNGRNVILDVSNLRYMDSTGRHVLIDAHKGLEQNKCRLVVVGASPMIAKLMRISGFDSLVRLVPSVDGAKDLLG